VSDNQEQQMIGLLARINENVGGIREEMAGIKVTQRKQGEDITEIKSDMKNENLPTRLSLVERDTARIIRGMWVVGTALAGLIVHRLWTIVTGKES
jgi:hypothetical protein